MASFVLAFARGAAADSAGFGAYPLTSTCASAWFIDHADSSGKRLHFITYTTGLPGWIRKGTNFSTGDDSLSFVCDGVPVHLVLNGSHASLEGREFVLAHDNVFLVTVGMGTATVRALGRHDLAFAEDDNPATELVARDASVREALTGRSTPKPAPASSPATPAAKIFIEARESYRKSELERACASFEQAAKLGLPEAEYAFGYCLQSGQGHAADLAAANAWYEKAAAHGNRNAMFKLGWSAREGRGMPKDAATALSWFRRCAAAGDSICQGLVGEMFEKGEGTTAQRDSALAWYGVAAERGVPDAQYRLVRAAAEDDADPSTGISWLTVLEAQPQLPDQISDDLSRWRPRIEARLTADQRDKARMRAEAWLVEESKRSLEALAR